MYQGIQRSDQTQRAVWVKCKPEERTKVFKEQIGELLGLCMAEHVRSAGHASTVVTQHLADCGAQLPVLATKVPQHLYAPDGTTQSKTLSQHKARHCHNTKQDSVTAQSKTVSQRKVRHCHSIKQDSVTLQSKIVSQHKAR